MYKETLAGQWTNLYSDFAQEYDRLIKQGQEPDSFARWYETRIHRWQSVAYPEGLILEQAGSAEFAQALTEVMKDFRFQSVETRQNRPLWRGILPGLAAGAASAVVLKLMDWGIGRVILSGVVVCIVAALGVARSEEAARNTERRRVKEAYVAQLKAYWQELAAVCDQFEDDV